MSFEPISAVLDIGGKLIDRLWPDPAEREQAKLELAKMQQTGELAQLTAETELAKGQLAINAEEVKSEDNFVRRWRAFIGWVGGAAIAYHFIIQPFISYIAALCGATVMPPVIDGVLLFNLVAALLGFGGMRTYEKMKGVNRN